MDKAGALCVMISGIWQMPMWPVECLDSDLPQQFSETLMRDQAESG